MKRLNFLYDSNINNLNDTMDLDLSNYKNALDSAIHKSFRSPDFIKPGPYLGIVLRVEPTMDKEDPVKTSSELRSWWLRAYGLGSETEAPVPEAIASYKVRIPELDACIPDPSEYCNNVEQESEAQKYIEMHTTFWANPGTWVGTSANPGDVVWVNFADYKTREGPVYMGPYFQGGQVSTLPNKQATKPSKAFDKCADVDFGGAPDGANLQSSDKLYEGSVASKFFPPAVEAPELTPIPPKSNEPKNTFPRECSIRTATGLANEPDTPEEEANLKYLEEEVIPRLLPALRKVDSRFVVTSVYRSDAVNAKVGGTNASYHAQGLGVDFGGLAKLPKKDRDAIMLKAADYLRTNRPDFPFMKKVIVELWRNHLHFSIYPQKEKNSYTRFTVWVDDGVWAELDTKLQEIA